MYTERYMDTPTENPEGYAAASLAQYAGNLQGKLMLVHGTDDDVVVMQHTMNFLKECVSKQVQVDFFAYPGHAHNVRGKDRVHLMKKVLDYLMMNL
ncbi:MAG: alpha/beta hydrolase family protein, partial [Bacteroidota bacterium]